MTVWILIFYLAGYNAGGPGTASFQTKEACEVAGAALTKAFPTRYGGHTCVQDR